MRQGPDGQQSPNCLHCPKKFADPCSRAVGSVVLGTRCAPGTPLCSRGEKSVHVGCYNKTIREHSFLMVLEAGKSKIRVLVENLVPGSSTVVFSVSPQGRRGKAPPWAFFPGGTPPIPDLAASHRPHLSIPSHWGLGSQHRNSGHFTN